MWIMTPIGFYSAVQHRDNHADLMVRARSIADLERLVAFAGGCLNPSLLAGIGPIETTLTHADYPHRIVVTKRTWKALLGFLTDDIDYANFKTAVGKVSPGRAHLYHDVWATMCKAEREPDAGVYVKPTPKAAHQHGKDCEWCGDVFVPRARRQKYCSHAHRQRAYEDRKGLR